jgi:RTX calcium-binding nonapeptide repeat (4 copies)
MASRTPAPPPRAPIPTSSASTTTRLPANVIGVAGASVYLAQDSLTTSATAYANLLAYSPSSHNLSLTGSSELTGYSDTLSWNKLDARTASGNVSLKAAPSTDVGVAPSSTTLYGGSGNNTMWGWTGNRTPSSIVSAASGSTSLVVSSTTGLTVGQYLGGNGIASGTKITAVSYSPASGFTTITLSKATTTAISGGTVYALPVATSSTTTVASAKGANTLTLAAASQFYVGQIITGTGIADATTVKAISGNTITLSTATTGTVVNSLILGLDSAPPPTGFVPNTDLFIGGSGSNTIYAGNVASTLVGGSKNNLLVADFISGANQSLWGGNNDGSTLYGNTLYGGTGFDTLRSGTGYNTLIAGDYYTIVTSLDDKSVPTTLNAGATSINLSGVYGLILGQTLAGTGIADGTKITSITPVTLTGYSTTSYAVGLSKATTATLSSGSQLTQTLYSSPTTSVVVPTLSLAAAASSGTTTLKVSSVAGLSTGQFITGNGIQFGTTIAAISGTTITLSTKTYSPIASGSSLGVALSSGSQNITVASVAGMAVGQMITGAGIAEGASITAIGNSWVTANATRGATTLTLASLPSSYRTGQIITGTGIAAGTTITAISGNTISLSAAISANIYAGSQITNNTITLSAITTSQITSGTSLSVISQVLIGGGISNSLVAGAGTDSLSAVSGASTLIGGIGKDTLTASTLSSSTNWLQSGSTGTGNTLRGGAGSNTLVAGSGGHDSIVGGTAQNLFLVTSANYAAFVASDTLSLSTLPGAKNTLGVSLSAATTIGDTFFSALNVKNLGVVKSFSNNNNPAVSLALGAAAESAGVGTLVSGLGKDTLSVAGYASLSALLDGSSATAGVSLQGSTVTGNKTGDTFKGSQNGGDTMTGTANADLFIIQNTAANTISGGDGVDTLQVIKNSALNAQTFNAISGIEVLSLAGGTSLQSGSNSVASIQGSGISTIYGGAGINSDVISASVTSSVKSIAPSNSGTITLTLLPGATGTMGFAKGQFISGNGIAAGTYISADPTVDRIKNTITLTLSQPTSAQVAQGTLINGWVNNFTIDGSKSQGQLAGNSNPLFNAVIFGGNDALKTVTGLANASSPLYKDNIGRPSELDLDVKTLLSLQNDTRTYIQTRGDSLVVGGYGELVKGAISTASDSLLSSSIAFSDSNGNIREGISFYSHVVTDNTITSGMFNTGSGGSRDLASNTLVGGPGQNLYILNNLIGDTLLPYIQNASSLQSGSTIQFTGNGVKLTDTSFAQVGARTAQKIITANGNNLIQLGSIAAPIGIQTITGGVSSDTFTTTSDYLSSVYFDGSKNGGKTSLASGAGNDTLLGGAGSSTLLGGDGNNSLRGGNGLNLIKSGVGNSTLDSGYGISTLQADGGTNHFVVRNRYTRILSPDQSNPSTGTIPEVGIVDTYVNFDPIQGSPVAQFSPYYPDNSPSITKSPSFASSDLANFYNLQYFNLLGDANYGVGNALDNTITAAAANALILGMGGNNTIVASGAGSSLYGDSNPDYASPDLYAYAPIDTRDQAFVDGVMGVAGNNSLVAKGAGSYLDGGDGYNDGLFDGSGSNTLIGTGGNDTVIQSHQSDFISLTGPSNTVITSVDLYQAPDNVSDLIVNVTPQLSNSGSVTFAGQRMTASYAAIAGATGGYTDTNSLSAGFAPLIVVNNSAKLQVAYGISGGTIYGSDNVPDAYLPLNVGTIAPDPKNTGKDAVILSWTTPLTPDGNPVGQTMGYLVNYQLVATDDSGNIISSTPYLTYLKGTSQDLTGTSTNPQLLVDNLPTSFTDPYGNNGAGITYYQDPTDPTKGYYFDPTTGEQINFNFSYNFKVTAQETVLPAYTNENGDLIASPVSLIGGQGNDVIYGGLLDNVSSNISNTRPVLTNNPNPLDNLAGLIPAPYGIGNSPTDTNSGLFPVYESGGLGGNDLLIAPIIGERSFYGTGSGNDFTAYEYLDGVPRAVTYSGLNTLEGGQGSDTFIVSNGGTTINATNGIVTTGAYDNIIKYGNETPVGQHNLVVSFVQYLSLSDTAVNQGKFIDQAWAAYGDQYIAGNRLDNTIASYFGNDTLLGGGGRDILDASKAAVTGDTLIGGTAYGLDSIGGALADYLAGQKNSIYRDTDPVPAGVNGPGTADNSQYWMVNGGFDQYRNSDTLLGATLAPNLLDGGAGNDSMVGGSKNDTLYVSDAFGFEHNLGIIGGDVVVGGGGNDWIVYTGSNVYWSGINIAYNTYTGVSAVGSATNSTLGYALSKDGDAAGGQSISNIKLQNGDSVARFAIGNATSTGNPQGVGSNILVGNEYNNTLDGAGVGGVDHTGTGVDVLTGGAGADYFIVSGYAASSSDQGASYSSSNSTDTLSGVTTNTYQITPGKYRTDKDYAIITDMSAADTIVLGGASNYLIGKAPTPVGNSSIGDNNIGSTALITSASTDFGIYTRSGNLVAEVKGIAVGTLGAIATVSATAANSPITVTATIDGQASTAAEPNHLGGSNFFSTTSNAGVINSGTALNYLGMGPMYELSGSAFASHVI